MIQTLEEKGRGEEVFRAPLQARYKEKSLNISSNTMGKSICQDEQVYRGQHHGRLYIYRREHECRWQRQGRRYMWRKRSLSSIQDKNNSSSSIGKNHEESQEGAENNKGRSLKVTETLEERDKGN